MEGRALRGSMAETPRRFCRFRHPSDSQKGTFGLPEDGMCLSVFLLLHPPGRPAQILMGRPSLDAPWDKLGAMDADRLRQMEDRWVLPASHLLLFEDPQAGADRLQRELLESAPVRLEGPQVASEAYARPSAPSKDPHWDIHFLFRGEWPDPHPPQATPWKELAFVEVTRTPRREYGRGHGDILALAGLPVPD